MEIRTAEIERLTMDAGSIIELPVAVQSPKVEQEVDLLMRLVTEDTLVQLQLARCAQVSRVEVGKWKLSRTNREIVIYSPDAKQEEIMATAIMSALMFERNGIVQRVHEYLDAVSSLPEPTPTDDRLAAVLRLLIEDIQMRGPYHRPANWQTSTEVALGQLAR